MRLPKRTIPVTRRASTAQVGGLVEPAFLGGVLKKGWNFIKGPGKALACSSCAFLPHPAAKVACMAACAL